MFDHSALKEQCRNYWAEQPSETGNGLNAFTGTFAFSDHDFVPELIRDLVMSQRNDDKFTRVPIETVNDIANKFWEGAGSCAMISDVIWHARIARAFGATFTESKGAYKLGYSVEEWAAIDKDRT